MLQRFLLGIFLLLSWGATQEAQAVVRIKNDPGGRISDYVEKYKLISQWGDEVVIDGPCASACTLALGIIPHDKLCVTSHAKLGFHQAYDLGTAASGAEIQVPNDEATALLISYYPTEVKQWIHRNHGLPLPNHLLWLKGRALTQLVHSCNGKLPAIY